MIIIRNTQRRIQCNEQRLVSFSTRAMAQAGYADWGLGIWITTNQTIRSYNARFRHKDKPTDILSFPFYPDLKPGKRPVVMDEEGEYLGDLIISAERVVVDARELEVTFEERMQVLIVHGICHLLGYDHETDAQYKVMQKRERELLAATKK
jgi:probable rRNA maturation factor